MGASGESSETNSDLVHEAAAAGQLPFVIGVLADLTGKPMHALPKLRDREFIVIDLSNFDDVLEALSPRLAFTVPYTLTNDERRLGIELRFISLTDFHPVAIARQVDPLRHLLELRSKLVDLRRTVQADERFGERIAEAVTDASHLDRLKEELDPHGDLEPPSTATEYYSRADEGEVGVWSSKSSLLDEIVEGSSGIATLQEKETRKDLVLEFVQQVLGGKISVSYDLEAMINSRIAQIDTVISEQLNQILHAPEYQTLEATWRGLHYLVRTVRKNAAVKIKLLNVSKKDLWHDLRHESEFRRPAVVQKVQEQEYGTLGGEPFGVVIGDYEFVNHPDDIDLLRRMARLGATAHVPFIAAAAPGLFELDSFKELADSAELQEVFDSIVYVKWHSFRQTEDSKYVGLVLPRFLLRPPYNRHTNAVREFDCEEQLHESSHAEYLWGNAVWIFAAQLGANFSKNGWCVHAGSAVCDLPVHHVSTGYGLIQVGPAEVTISDCRYAQLRDAGFIAFCQAKSTVNAAFFDAPSSHKPVPPDKESEPDSAAAQLEYVFAACRMAHCVQHVVQHQRHKFRSWRECEDHLYRWIYPHVVQSHTGEGGQFPLTEARFRVTALSGREQADAVVEAQFRVGGLKLPVKVVIPVILRKLGASEIDSETAPPALSAAGELVRYSADQWELTRLAEMANGDMPGRERFVRRLLVAEECFNQQRIDAATLILEDLAMQIDRHHLDEWESPKLISRVWGLLRRCYQIAPSSPDVAEHSDILLRRMCRLNASNVIE